MVMMRSVDPAEWDLSGMRDSDRAGRLLNPPEPEQLIEMLATITLTAPERSEGTWRWQLGLDMPGCGRAIFVLPCSQESFDYLFNGRSGYRAQYYLSEADGRRFNDALLSALRPSMRAIFDRAPADDWRRAELSLAGPHSKLWVFGDGAPFAHSDPDEFKPRRWAERPTIWLRAPLPELTAIEVKGTWVSEKDGGYREDPSCVS